MKRLDWIIFTIYTTLYHTHWLLSCKRYIQITINQSFINMESKNNSLNKMKTLDWNTIRIYAILYHTYQLLYYKGLYSDDNIHRFINMESKTIEWKKCKQWIEYT